MRPPLRDLTWSWKELEPRTAISWLLGSSRGEVRRRFLERDFHDQVHCPFVDKMMQDFGNAWRSWRLRLLYVVKEKILGLRARAQDLAGSHTSRSNSSRCIRRLCSHSSASFFSRALCTRLLLQPRSLGSLRSVQAGVTQGRMRRTVN